MFIFTDEIRNLSGYMLFKNRFMLERTNLNEYTRFHVDVEIFGKYMFISKINKNLEAYEKILTCFVNKPELNYNGKIGNHHHFTYSNIEFIDETLDFYNNLNDYINYISANESYFEEIYRKYDVNEKSLIYNENTQSSSFSKISDLSGIEFEHLSKKLLEKMGLEVEMTRASHDGGIDLIAINNSPLLFGKYIVQCKRYSGSVGEPIIRDLYGVVMSERANKGVLITTGNFSQSAINFARDKQLELIDGNKLSVLLDQYGINYGIDNSISSTKNKILNDILIEYHFGSEDDEYISYTSKLSDNPKDIRTRTKLIMYLLDKITGLFKEINNLDDQTIIINDIQKHIKIAEQQVSMNKVYRDLNLVLIMYNINLFIFKGDFEQALQLYLELLQFPETISSDELCKTLKEKDWLYYALFETSYNIIQISSCSEAIGLKLSRTDLLYNMTREVFKSIYSMYSKVITNPCAYKPNQISYAKSIISIIDNQKHPFALFMFDTYLLNVIYNQIFLHTQLPYSISVENLYLISIVDDSLMLKYQDMYCNSGMFKPDYNKEDYAKINDLKSRITKFNTAF